MPDYWEYPFRFYLKYTATEDEPNGIETDKVPTGRSWRIDHLLTIDESNPCDQIQVVISGDGEDYVLVVQDDPLEDVSYWWEGPVYLWPGDWLTARFHGADNRDLLRFYVMGVERRAIP